MARRWSAFCSFRVSPARAKGMAGVLKPWRKLA